LTAAARAGGAAVWVCGSMEGQVVTPPCFPPGVIVPAGSISADFPITAPQVNAPHYVLIQATYGTTGGMQAKLLEIDPAPGAPVLFAMGVKPSGLIGGASARGTVELVMPAPAGGGVVTLSSDNPSVVQVPPSIAIAAGNSTNSFTITTSPVSVATGVSINASAGGVTKSAFINLGPDPNAALALTSVTLSVAGVTGGNSVNGTVFLNANAPAGGASGTLATSNLSAARVPPTVLVPAGLGFATFTVTPSPVSANTPAGPAALLARPRHQLRRSRRAVLGRAPLHRASRATTASRGEPVRRERRTDLGRGRQLVTGHRDADQRRAHGRSRGEPEQRQPGGGCRARQRHRRGREDERDLHHPDDGRHGLDCAVDHRDLRRRFTLGRADRQSRARGAEPVFGDGQSAKRGWRRRGHGNGDVDCRRTNRRSDRRTVDQQRDRGQCPSWRDGWGRCAQRQL